MPFPPRSSLFSWTWPLLLAAFFAVASVSATPTKIGKGYKLVSVEESPDGGIIGLLQVKKKNNVYGPDIPYLQLYVKHETDSRLRVHVTDAELPRWEVPYDIIPREKPAALKKPLSFDRKSLASSSSSSYYQSSSELIFSYKADPFTFSVKRKSTGQTLFDSDYNTLVFKDQYLEISTVLPKNASLYGLGESSRVHGHRLYPNDPPYTLFTTDVAAINLNTDLYGSHPVYMDLRNDGGGAFAHAVLLMNSNGMDVFYRGDSLTYKVIGGVLDYYFFSGPSPLEVVDQYTAFIGRPAPMPYWSFGFHQCRWGYHNLSVVEDVVENYKKAKIPLDVIWNDDDHMDGHKDFTLNPVTYPRTKLLAFLEKIHAEGMKYIVINDPGIGVNNSYGTFVRAMEKDLFIKYNGQPFLAQVWPGAVYFPDFLNPKTTEWWVDEIKRFHELVPIDGLWTDMNEVSNFCNGLCTIPKGKVCPSGYGPGWVCCLDCKNITQTKWDDPPYKINASGIQALPGYKTIATSAVHYNGVREYDAHSIYGLTEAIATHKGLQGIAGKRPFILSRATFVSSGHYAAHWTGDNQGTWEDLKISISTMLDFGLFGVPMVGSDICGFYPDWSLKDPKKAEELCNRWIELGAFYPFSRDHANFYSPRQELYQWESVAESARNALGLRYKLLPYFYTLSYEAHISGAPIARPLFYSFPENTMLYGLSTQFLLGSSVMVSPVLDPNRTTVKVLFPAGSWYSLFDMTKVVDSKGTHNVTLDAPIHVIHVHVYQNTILPMQQGGMISKQARMTPFSLIISFPLGASEGQAKGKLFLDNDELPEMKLASGTASYIEFYATMSNKTVKVWSNVQEGDFALSKGWTIERVAVLGLDAVQVSSALAVEVEGDHAVDVSKAEFSQALHSQVVKVEEEGGEKTSMMVEVKGLNLPVGKKFTMSWHMGV